MLLLALVPSAVLSLAPLVDPAAAESATAAPAVAEILEKVVAAHGGDAVRECPGYRARGRVLSLVDGRSGRLRLSVALDGSFRSEIRYPGREEIRILAGRLAWNGGSRRQTLAGAEMSDSMHLQFHRMAAPFELAREDAAALTLLPESEEGWIRLERVWNSRTRTVYEIDPESGRIRRIRGEVTQAGDAADSAHGKDGALEFVSEANDFREVDGILFPFRITSIVAGDAAAEIILDRVQIEPDFDADEFRPAGSGGGDI
ncbi:MAG: hypothetical protein HKN12_05340 [Gemmatimonadetes bacterium]|nr:hypothetical protein [Gemmatimonadota bacterium]